MALIASQEFAPAADASVVEAPVAVEDVPMESASVENVPVAIAPTEVTAGVPTGNHLFFGSPEPVPTRAVIASAIAAEGEALVLKE